MIAAAFRLLLPLLGNSILKPVLDYLTARQNVDLEQFKAATGAERDVLLAQLQAEVAANAQRAAMASTFFGWWLTRWLIGIMLACAIAHQCAVFLDSLCWVTAARPHGGCGFGFPKLPPPYDEREWLLISTLFGIQQVPNAIAAFARAVEALRK
jgi:hypothetical protein